LGWPTWTLGLNRSDNLVVIKSLVSQTTGKRSLPNGDSGPRLLANPLQLGLLAPSLSRQTFAGEEEIEDHSRRFQPPPSWLLEPRHGRVVLVSLNDHNRTLYADGGISEPPPTPDNDPQRRPTPPSTTPLQRYPLTPSLAAWFHSMPPPASSVLGWLGALLLTTPVRCAPGLRSTASTASQPACPSFARTAPATSVWSLSPSQVGFLYCLLADMSSSTSPYRRHASGTGKSSSPSLTAP
jgi:hypothetical protein